MNHCHVVIYLHPHTHYSYTHTLYTSKEMQHETPPGLPDPPPDSSTPRPPQTPAARASPPRAHLKRRGEEASPAPALAIPIDFISSIFLYLMFRIQLLLGGDGGHKTPRALNHIPGRHTTRQNEKTEIYRIKEKTLHFVNIYFVFLQSLMLLYFLIFLCPPFFFAMLSFNVYDYMRLQSLRVIAKKNIYCSKGKTQHYVNIF